LSWWQLTLFSGNYFSLGRQLHCRLGVTIQQGRNYGIRTSNPDLVFYRRFAGSLWIDHSHHGHLRRRLSTASGSTSRLKLPARRYLVGRNDDNHRRVLRHPISPKIITNPEEKSKTKEPRPFFLLLFFYFFLKKPRGNDSQHRIGFRQGSLTVVDLEAVIRGGITPPRIQLIYSNVRYLVKG